jgi:hypothetical protein
MCPSWMNKYLPKTPSRVRQTEQETSKTCVQEDPRYADYGSHPTLKIESSNSVMMTWRSTLLSDDNAPSTLI